ncbi:MAG: MIP/aquaporin family protein [Vicinamibacterales bacterium]
MKHWPEYASESVGLALFMFAAAVVGTVLEHPGSPVRQAIDSPAARRFVMGLVMGASAIGSIHSPWGRRSGAHLNPAVTLTFWRLGKMEGWDALFYVGAQFLGGLAGLTSAWTLLREALADPAVAFIATRPGAPGEVAALLAEIAIAGALMLTVLVMTNRARLRPFTGLAVGLLLVAYITVEAPISGMSLNPARSFASAAVSGDWRALWIYFVAPPLGMLGSAEAYIRVAGVHRVLCARLVHAPSPRVRCIFRCSDSTSAS